MSILRSTEFMLLFTVLWQGAWCEFFEREYAPRKWYTGTMTPYEVIGNLDDTPVKFEGYEPKKIWVVGRHGPRFPEEKTLNAMFDVLHKIQDELSKKPESPCYSEELMKWKALQNLGFEEIKSTNEKHDSDSSSAKSTKESHPDIPPAKSTDESHPHIPPTKSSKESQSDISAAKTSKKSHPDVPRGKLTKSMTIKGKESMAAMGERFRERFPDLIPEKLDSRTEFKFSKTLRTRESAYSFATGLFHTDFPADDPQFHEAKSSNYILKFDSYCLWWKVAIKKTPAMIRIFKAYDKGEEINNVLKQVRETCLLPNLDRKALKHIYMTCSYELLWHDASPWCHFFKEDSQLDVIEYIEDLKLFNTCAYGNEWNHKIACPMLKDMVDFLTDDKSKVQARFGFSHAKTLIKFASHLNLYRDPKEMLGAYNYVTRDKRTFVSSKFAGFSFNFTFVLFESKEDRNKRALLFLLNERPTIIPGCPEDTYLCPLETFREKYKESLEECDFENWCKHDEYEPIYDELCRQLKEQDLETSSSEASVAGD